MPENKGVLLSGNKYVKALLVLLSIAGCQAGPERAAVSYERADIPRTVSITIDDLPVVAARDLNERQQITNDLLAKVTQFRIPAVGFVNERKLFDPDIEDIEPDEVALLEAWLDSGLELANHSYSHFRFDETPLELFQEDVLRGETVTGGLMEQRGMQMRYFRHPYLNIGDDTGKINLFNDFLSGHSYITAPVTVDNSDWFYNRAYVNALRDGDDELAVSVADDYVRYMEEVFKQVERFTSDVLGREPAQILLLHANRLNGDHFHRIAGLISDLGYQFVSLEEALADTVYAMPGVYNEPSVIRALRRTWRERGGEDEDLPQRPPVPDWVTETAERSRPAPDAAM